MEELIWSMVVLIALLAYRLGVYATRAGTVTGQGRSKGRGKRNSAAISVDPVALILTLLGMAKAK